jgi:hypothetical protein
MAELFEELRKRAFKEMLTADLNYRYWGRLCGRYAERDKRAKLLVAFASSGTVASWRVWSDVDLLWKGFSMSAAVVGLSLPIFNWAEMSRNASDLQSVWFGILRSYEELWPRIEARHLTTHELEAALVSVTNEEKRTIGLASKFTYDEELASLCQSEVLNSRGLSKEMHDGDVAPQRGGDNTRR